MVGFTANAAAELLLRAIKDRQEWLGLECERVPPFRYHSEEMPAFADARRVRWLPSNWFDAPLTRHQRNLAGEAIRRLADQGLV